MSLFFGALAGLLLTAVSVDAQATLVVDPITFVDPLIGSANGGNVFAGACVPYGMTKPVADTNSSSNQGGFAQDPGAFVTGFSSMHDSGTGGSPSLGNFAMFPYAGCPDGDVNRCAFPKKTRADFGAFENKSVSALPGYFGLQLANGIKVDMTATARASLYRFQFPATAMDGKPSQPLILQDLTDLSDSRQDNGTVNVDGSSGRITGSARFNPSFGVGNYVLHFCTDFRGAEILDNGIWVNSRANATVKTLTISRSINGFPLPGGAFIRFKSADKPILARTATSFISVDQACGNAEREIPDFDFSKAQDAATAAWREKLAPIKIDATGVDQSLVKTFYSGIYRTMINPQNYTGENPLWASGEPYFDSFYCLWDSFRSQIPFLIIVDPSAVAQMVRSLIDTYSNLGWLPDCRMSLCKGFTQGGSNADNVLADAFMKGIAEGVDWNKGYEAVVKDAEVEPFDWSVNGRGGLDSWKALGYIPVQDFDYKGFGTMTRSVSRSLEYSYNDFCISQMAGKLGKQADKEKYTASSGNWANLFKADQASALFDGTPTGFTGFFQPKYMNGTWDNQNPLTCSGLDANPTCSLQVTGKETFESSLWEYGYFVPHDQAKLMTLYGGPENFARRLDYMHDQKISNIGNEPSFLTVFQYHYAGRPALSAKRSHSYTPGSFRAAPDGLPGNDDSGAMGSFVAFSMLGLFPNPGQDVYFITPPFFPAANVTSPATGKVARIRTVNFDPAYRNISIQSATLDGRPYTRNWLDHSFFADGKELVLTLGPTESGWGTRAEDVPPSLSPYSGLNGSARGSV
ncbi:hypothetical protein RB595_000197 [Gaeumannomyces hyphopodioides]